MEIMGMSAQALNGMNRGMEQLQRAADDVSRVQSGQVPADTGDLVQPLVAQMEGARQVEAAVQVLDTDDKMLGSMLDVLA